MPLGTVLVLTVAVVTASLYIHYEVLRVVSEAMPNMRLPPRSRLLVVLGAVTIAHLLEIGLFAVGYGLLDGNDGFGALTGLSEGKWLDYFYFSAATYTTLGIGDIIPTGPLRLVAAVESLFGLVLIGWSASFTFLAMQKFWGLHKRSRAERAGD
ncbi:MAG: two pore domain potassium channel family protein [Alphaproteobacteria bacterium]|nr:two pore domain potassium channel family protein [Alphaproteobacteria bacterium]